MMANYSQLTDYLNVTLKFHSLYSDLNHNYVIFRTQPILGDWFGLWFHLFVEIPLPNIIYLKEPITLRSILHQTNDIKISRQPTGWLSFLYRHLNAEILMDRRSQVLSPDRVQSMLEN